LEIDAAFLLKINLTCLTVRFRDITLRGKNIP